MWTEEWIEVLWISNDQVKHSTEPKRAVSRISRTQDWQKLLPNYHSFLFYCRYMNIFLWFTLVLIYIKKFICKSVYKAEADQWTSKTSKTFGMKLFIEDVKGWKLLTIATEWSILNVIWSLDLLLYNYLRFWNLINWPLPFEFFLRFWWHQQSI